MLFDTHAHYSEEDGPFDAWIQRAQNANVPFVLLCSSGWENSHLSKTCAESAENVYFAAGIHPQEAALAGERDYLEYAWFPAECRKCAAIGEIGLDYYYETAPREIQKRVFRDFLGMAREYKIPAVVHCRDQQDSGPAYEDAWELLAPFAERGGRFVLHAFAGSPEWQKRFESIGAMFGVGGMLTFKKADNIRQVVSQMSMDRIMLETDSPYLAPVPFRGKTNHPALVPYIAQALADLKGISAEEAEKITTENALNFFRIPKGNASW